MESGESFKEVEDLDLWGYFELLKFQKAREKKAEKEINTEAAIKILG